ncbi:hypothetical protein B0J13DRAFT_82800 [Dactylonectria estremocensis]|uniref:ABM domain-containing protein n=1 Tax=Dactylonectria estremocensis TaxID=1079267 RepID=A0A9P9EH15_9HYPO|nr:hypothetical protein B0J13DRAFT_82800 [Dactylonectria estremocensis]
MPVTELLFPQYKQGLKTLAGLKENGPKIFATFKGVEGLQSGFRGRLLEENGNPIDPSAMRSVLILEWVKVSHFHDFFPNSDRFRALLELLKPLSAAPAIPILFESAEWSTPGSAASKITQIIRVEQNNATGEAWEKLKESIEEFPVTKPSFYHATGVEKAEGTFLGLIGWKSLEDYEEAGKHSTILERIRKLNESGSIDSVIVELEQIDTA